MYKKAWVVVLLIKPFFFFDVLVASAPLDLKASIIAELRARSAPAEHHGQVNLPIPENLVITWPYTARSPSVRTASIPMFTLTLSRFYLLWEPREPMRKLIARQCCYQLTAVKTRYPVTSITWPYPGLRCRPIQVEYFLKLSADKSLVFKWWQAHFLKFMWNMLCLCHYGPAPLTFWFQTDLGRQKFSQLFKNTGGKDKCFSLFSP